MTKLKEKDPATMHVFQWIFQKSCALSPEPPSSNIPHPDGLGLVLVIMSPLLLR